MDSGLSSGRPEGRRQGHRAGVPSLEGQRGQGNDDAAALNRGTCDGRDSFNDRLCVGRRGGLSVCWVCSCQCVGSAAVSVLGLQLSVCWVCSCQCVGSAAQCVEVAVVCHQRPGITHPPASLHGMLAAPTHPFPPYPSHCLSLSLLLSVPFPPAV
eukprot:84335-Chlamydomonas_euryale.AAC.1